ncbi:lipoate--protein ligase family protein, partial [Candidatus Bipolaricaulota bacterium]|nr:lipoate--protein ligase family protein [Candidatus Bipolaricaulota bacterium]
MNSKNDGDISSSEFDEQVRTIVDLEIRDPAINIGLEEAIRETVSRGGSLPTIRFWRNPRAAIIGRSQEAEVEVDLENCRADKIPVVRRPTGGGAVLHHPNNLNYSIYLPETSSTSVEQESIKMSKPVAWALSDYGLDIRVEHNGLFAGSTKIGGTAQSRRRGLLHHGTLLVKGDSIIREMDSFLRAEDCDYREIVSRVASKPDQVSNLDNLVKARVRLLVLVKKMARSIADALDRR